MYLCQITVNFHNTCISYVSRLVDMQLVNLCIVSLYQCQVTPDVSSSGNTYKVRYMYPCQVTLSFYKPPHYNVGCMYP